MLFQRDPDHIHDNQSDLLDTEQLGVKGLAQGHRSGGNE